MRIVIAGAGSVGRSIARELLSHGHAVVLVDRQPEQMKVASVAEADWMLADACSPDALAELGLDNCDVMVAATGDDKVNLVVSLLAKSEFAVPRVVARVNNPDNEWMFDSTWGVDVPVSTPRIMSALVEEAVSVGTMVRIFTFHDSGASMYALLVPPGSRAAGNSLAALGLPPNAVLAAILRDSRPIPPDPDDIVREGDELLLVVPDDQVEDRAQIERLFAVAAQ